MELIAYPSCCSIVSVFNLKQERGGEGQEEAEGRYLSLFSIFLFFLSISRENVVARTRQFKTEILSTLPTNIREQYPLILPDTDFILISSEPATSPRRTEFLPNFSQPLT